MPLTRNAVTFVFCQLARSSRSTTAILVSNCISRTAARGAKRTPLGILASQDPRKRIMGLWIGPAELARDDRRTLEQQRERGIHRSRVEARARALEGDDGLELSARRADRCGDRRESRLALAGRLFVSALAHLLDRNGERLASRDRAGRVGAERAVRELATGECEHHLSGRGRVRDRRATESRHGLDLMRAGNEINGDRVLVAGYRERRRLAGRFDQRDEVWAGDLANVEAREHGVREVDELNAEPVAAARVDALDETGRSERPELARDGARRHARSACDLVRAELAAFCKGVEHRDRSLGSANSTG